MSQQQTADAMSQHHQQHHQQQHQQPKNNLLLNMALGGSAAAYAGLFTNPMEVVKVRFQLQRELSQGNALYSSLTDCLKKIYHYEGIKGIQAGLPSAIAYQIVMNSVRIGCFESVTNLPAFASIDAKDRPILNAVWTFLVGGVFGGIGAFCGAPLFLVKTRLQTANHSNQPGGVIGQQYGYKGTFDGLKQVYQHQGGIRGLWRNASVSASRVFMGGGIQLSCYDYFKHLVSTYTPLSSKSNPFAFSIATSLLSAFFVTVAMNPFDVVVTRMNNQSIENPKYQNALDCFRKVALHEGLGGFMKGFTSHFARLGPHVILTFTSYEWLKRTFVGSNAREQLRLQKEEAGKTTTTNHI